MANDYNKPINTDDLLLVLPQIVDNTDDVARMFDGVSPITNPKDKFKQLHANGYFTTYNASASAWEDEVFSKFVFDSVVGLSLLDEDSNGITLTTESLTDIQVLDFTASARFLFGGNEVITALSSGFVGINKSNPSYALDVNGDINLSGNLYLNGGTFEAVDKTYVDTADANLQTQIDALSSTTGMTADAIEELRAGMSEAEFRALQKERKSTRVGSGFDDFGEPYENSNTDTIKGSLQTRAHNYIESYYANKILTYVNGKREALSCINGVNSLVGQVNSGEILLPPAPSDENARQDLVGVEYFEQLVSEKNFIFPNGCIQSQASTMDGIATVTASFIGADTFSLFSEDWQTAGDLTGKGLIWSGIGGLSHADRLTVLSNPDNNLFWNEDGELVQGCFRIRVVQGLTTNGAEWGNINPDLRTSNAYLFYTSSSMLKPKGSLVSIQNDLEDFNPAGATTGYYSSAGNSSNNNDNMKDVGVFTAIGQSYSYDTSIAYKGHCYFLPITMVSRNRNQGAFDAEFNPDGSASSELLSNSEFSDLSDWSLSGGVVTHESTYNGESNVAKLVADTLNERIYFSSPLIVTSAGDLEAKVKCFINSTNYTEASCVVAFGIFDINANNYAAAQTLEVGTDSWNTVNLQFNLDIRLGHQFEFRIWVEVDSSFGGVVPFEVGISTASVKSLFSSSSDCFIASKLRGGNIASGISGRPDGLYYDEINERDVRDLRLPTFYEEVTSARCNSELNKCFSNQNRGYEAEFEITDHITSPAMTTSGTISNYGPTSTRVIFGGNPLFGYEAYLGNTTNISKDILVFIENDDGEYMLGVFVQDLPGESQIFLHPRHGDVSHGGANPKFTVSSTYKVILAQRTDSFSNNKITRCEIIGDPANYSFSNHVGVPNLIDVNNLSSNLPADVPVTSIGIYDHKVFRLTKRIDGINNFATGARCFHWNGSTISELIYNYSDVAIGNGVVQYFYIERNKCELHVNANIDDNDLLFVYYEGYANEFDSSVNEEVEGRVFSDSYHTNSSYISRGCVLLNELTERISTSLSAPYYRIAKLSSYALAPNDGLLTEDSSAYTVENESVTLGAVTGGIKAFLYCTNKDGLLYPCLDFKEMIHNGTSWGDNSKFEITDYIKTTTDDNANVIVYGTVVGKNPIGFAKE